MKPVSFALLTIIVVCNTQAARSSGISDSTVFTGTTPCSNVIRKLHKIPEEADCKWNECKCMMVEWKLILFANPGTSQPTGYKLTGINRYSVKETNMPSQPRTITVSEGKWSIVTGNRSNTKAVVYRLNPDDPARSIDLLKLGDKMLHVLDNEGRLMIGNEFHNYTLSSEVIGK